MAPWATCMKMTPCCVPQISVIDIQEPRHVLAHEELTLTIGRRGVLDKKVDDQLAQKQAHQEKMAVIKLKTIRESRKANKEKQLDQRINKIVESRSKSEFVAHKNKAHQDAKDREEARNLRTEDRKLAKAQERHQQIVGAAQLQP